MYEVSIQDTGGASGRAGARPDPSGVPESGRGDREGSGISGSRAYAAVGATGSVAGETGEYIKGRSSRLLQAEFSELRKRYWGQHMWARGYFCATVGAVDEATIKAYIENQKWDEDEEGF